MRDTIRSVEYISQDQRHKAKHVGPIFIRESDAKSVHFNSRFVARQLMTLDKIAREISQQRKKKNLFVL